MNKAIAFSHELFIDYPKNSFSKHLKHSLSSVGLMMQQSMESMLLETYYCLPLLLRSFESASVRAFAGMKSFHKKSTLKKWIAALIASVAFLY
ncbi:MAG: hypothetical protein HY537_18430 [Deltaproteobacteria bacterium]|nr:hypothetical protein [Deltaproteobacteria bacterium]